MHLLSSNEKKMSTICVEEINDLLFKNLPTDVPRDLYESVKERVSGMERKTCVEESNRIFRKYFSGNNNQNSSLLRKQEDSLTFLFLRKKLIFLPVTNDEVVLPTGEK